MVEVQYFARDDLRLKQDAPGARMWAVSLEKVMFTYFEVQPDSRFERHSHESEQITMVLDGTLYFELDRETLSVGPGEVVAIPSNVPHAAFTKEAPVKAVDAWSPVMQKY
jgi:quercetin dioxygenase-like cupin family protein